MVKFFRLFLFCKEKDMALKNLFGDRAFYKRVLCVAVPIMIQMGITNFVNLLDNIMVGSLSTEAMSGVAIVNQFMFIMNLAVFGSISAAGIFTAQYHGSGDREGVKATFRLKMLICLTVSLIAIGIFFFLDDELISLFLHTGSESGDLAATLLFGKEYLAVILIGIIPYAMTQVYASTMRETGETVVPMVASLSAVAVNFFGNLLLIFGLCGFPKLGVVGAAIATTVSRFVELGFLALWGHTHRKRYPFLDRVFRSFRIPLSLVRRVTVKGLPLLLNELLWATAMTFRNQCYSTRGLDAVAAQNIATTIFNVFNVVYLALGNAIAIMVGNCLGAGDEERAKDEDRKLITFSVLCATGMGILLIAVSPFFPMLYNTGDTVRGMATYMIAVLGILMPSGAFAHAGYFTLRSGGKVGLTFIFDSGFMWGVVIPSCLLLAHLTPITIFLLYPICQSIDILKNFVIGYFVKRGSWAKCLVSGEKNDA